MSQSALRLYWWNPIREPRDLQWLLRTERRSWVRMAGFGSRSVKNFGDELSRRVVTEATGRPTVWSPPRTAELFGIGSVIEKHAETGSRARIWGSGLRVGEAGPLPIGAGDVLAVRGDGTRGRLGLSPATPLGDPGLIARSIYRRPARRKGIVLLPHFLAFGETANDSVIEAASHAGMRVLPPTSPVDEVCNSIAAADLVVTSSLHGLIVGHAVGTPTVLTAFDASAEPGFKYHDYMSAFGRAPRFWTLRDLLTSGLEKARVHAAAERDAVDGPIDHLVERLVTVASVLR